MLGRPGNEIRLLQASLQGRTEAFEAIVVRYQSLVCAITYSSTGSVETSEELAQETFLRAWKSLHQLQDLTKFKAWLCSIARSTVQNRFRTRRRDLIGKAAPLEGAVDTPSHEAGPEEEAMRKEQQAVVARALLQMPESLREPLVLFYREQKSIRQVAQQLGLSENAARQRIARGRNAMKEKVAAMVETTIASTRPGKAFTVAVAGAIAAAGARDAAAVGVSSGSAGLTLGSMGKVVVSAAAVMIVVGGALIYRHRSRLAVSPSPSPAVQAPDRSTPAPALPGLGDVQATLDAEPIAAAGANEPADQVSGSAITDGIGAEGAQFEDPSYTAGEAVTRAHAFQAKGVLSGRVTDAATGEPIVGAGVELAGMRYRDTTDEQGFYSIEQIEEDGEYRIRVNSRRHLVPRVWDELPLMHLSADGRAVKHFSLRPGCMVDVSVCDERGNTVEGARVVASWLGTQIHDPRELVDLGQGRTSSRGRTKVGPVEPTEIAYRLIASHPDYAPGYVDMKLNDPDVVERARIVLRRGIKVQGYVEYADGVPAEGTQISAQPDWWHSSSSTGFYPVEAEGLFTLQRITPGTYSLMASVDPPGSRSSSWFLVTQAQLPLAKGQSLLVRLPQNSPQSLVAIRGRILWTSDERPATLHVSAIGSNPRCNGSVSLEGDAEVFEIGMLDPGTYMLRFTGPGLVEETVHRVAAPSDDLEVVLSYQGIPQLSGRVIDAASGRPIDAFRARVIHLRDLPGPSHPTDPQWNSFTQGQFSQSVSQGVYQVQVMAEGYAPTLSEAVRTDASSSVMVQLTSGGSLTGRVVNAVGEPIHGATVVPLSTARGSQNHESDLFMGEEGAVQTVDGQFVFEHLPPGQERLKVMHPEYCPLVVKTAEVVEGQVASNDDIVLIRGGAVEGTVYDVQGRPQPEVTVYAQDHQGYAMSGRGTPSRLGVAVTDANGFYRIDHLPVDDFCYVMRRDSGRVEGVVHRACVPVAGRTVRLDLGGMTVLRGSLAKDGAILPLTRLHLSGPDSDFSMAFRYYGQTDDHGRFALYGVPPGRYGLYYERPGVRADWVRACLVQVGRENIDLGRVHGPAGQVRVLLHSADPTIDLSGWQVSLEEGLAFRGRPAGMLNEDASTASVRVIEEVAPGVYQVVAWRDDVAIRKAVTVESVGGSLEVELEIPSVVGTVSGALVTDTNQTVILWNSSRTVTVHLPARGDSYIIESLPVGQYEVGDYFLNDRAPLLTFELKEGEHTTVDIDLTRHSYDLGLLGVSLVDDNGAILNHARVWLEGPTGRIDAEPGVTGSYRFMSRPGDYTLFVRCPGHQPHAERLTLPRTRIDRASILRAQKVVRLNP